MGDPVVNRKGDEGTSRNRERNRGRGEVGRNRNIR